MKPIGFIPARGGSKRFHGKHLALLGGKPLMAWTIEAALTSGVFHVVTVSSDDDAILRTAQRYGAVCHIRAPHLSGDDVTVLELCLEAFKESEGVLYLLAPTSPFRTAASIQQAWKTFATGDVDALLSVVPAHTPWQWSLCEPETGQLAACMPNEYNRPRSSLKPTWRHDGGHQIVWLDRFRYHQSFLMPKTALFRVPPEEAVDIDTPLDLAWAEFLLDRRRGGLL